jgi:hypothetical protein
MWLHSEQCEYVSLQSRGSLRESGAAPFMKIGKESFGCAGLDFGHNKKESADLRTNFPQQQAQPHATFFIGIGNPYCAQPPQQPALRAPRRAQTDKCALRRRAQALRSLARSASRVETRRCRSVKPSSRNPNHSPHSTCARSTAPALSAGPAARLFLAARPPAAPRQRARRAGSGGCAGRGANRGVLPHAQVPIVVGESHRVEHLAPPRVGQPPCRGTEEALAAHWQGLCADALRAQPEGVGARTSAARWLCGGRRHEPACRL